jgi:hypothetical protein
LVRKIASPIGPIYFSPLRAAGFASRTPTNFENKLAGNRNRSAIAAALRPCFSRMIATPPLCGYIAPRDPATGVSQKGRFDSIDLPLQREMW